MNTKTLMATTAAGLSLAFALSSCGGSNPDHTVATTTTSPTIASSTVTNPPVGPPSILPEPSGPLAVGVRTVPSVSPDATTRVWYPARPRTGTGPIEYLDGRTATAFFLAPTQLGSVEPRATVNAVPAPATTPRSAVVLMPGWGSVMALSTALAQDLASNGYVVVTVDPTYGTEDRFTLPADTAHPGRRAEQLAAALDFVTGPHIAAIAGRVASNRIAVGGHSIAGAMAFQTSLVDSRVRAVFDLDGWLHGPALESPVKVPALVVDASGLDPDSAAIIGRTPKAVTVKLTGATHFDVTDVPCLVPALGPVAPSLGLGTIGCTGTTTTNTVVLRFLNAVLKHGAASPQSAKLTAGLGGVQTAR